MIGDVGTVCEGGAVGCRLKARHLILRMAAIVGVGAIAVTPISHAIG